MLKAGGIETKELASETRSLDKFAPRVCSLKSNQFDTREQNQGAKVLLRNTFFASLIASSEEGALLPGACCGSVFQEQAPSCGRALRDSKSFVGQS